jgi:hypothetical protein
MHAKQNDRAGPQQLLPSPVAFVAEKQDRLVIVAPRPAFSASSCTEAQGHVLEPWIDEFWGSAGLNGCDPCSYLTRRA